MSLQDPLSDLFSRIRNAQMRNKPIVSSPVSKLRENILEVLKKEGYIRGYARTKHSSGREELDIELKYARKKTNTNVQSWHKNTKTARTTTTI